MPRGRRRQSPSVTSLEQEIESLKQRQLALRQQLRRMRNSDSEVRKLEDKLTKQLGTARWTAQQIKELNPGWDEEGFYASVEPKQPTPRGRRRRTTTAEEA
ncbi:MAG: hypothetical protein ACK47B_03950 [Armatimonadota bacterium]